MYVAIHGRNRMEIDYGRYLQRGCRTGLPPNGNHVAQFHGTIGREDRRRPYNLVCKLNLGIVTVNAVPLAKLIEPDFRRRSVDASFAAMKSLFRPLRFYTMYEHALSMVIEAFVLATSVLNYEYVDIGVAN
ncbi:hypothetical protein PIB30_056680 [Stylosanthes scabra]|uniref:Uncharacterized protein n=1 Tax=Stylosanthes scabra TaxID=79078 RepID=A0ABU6YI92_9FABA|nr:hypothetical protein [Stylosanthes scabra]